jgi:hypothetical protein
VCIESTGHEPPSSDPTDYADLADDIMLDGKPIPAKPPEPLDRDVAERLAEAERVVEEEGLDEITAECVRIAATLPPEVAGRYLDEIQEMRGGYVAVPAPMPSLRRGPSRSPRTRRVVRRARARAPVRRSEDDDPHDIAAGALA